MNGRNTIGFEAVSGICYEQGAVMGPAIFPDSLKSLEAFILRSIPRRLSKADHDRPSTNSWSYWAMRFSREVTECATP